PPALARRKLTAVGVDVCRAGAGPESCRLEMLLCAVDGFQRGIPPLPGVFRRRGGTATDADGWRSVVVHACQEEILRPDTGFGRDPPRHFRPDRVGSED